MSTKNTQRLKWFLVLSLVAHFSVYLGLGRWSSWTEAWKQRQQQTQIVEIEYLAAPRPQKMQLVEQDEKALNDEVPEDAKFISRHNQKVVKETKASLTGDYKNTGAGGDNETQPQVKKSAPEKPKAPKRAESKTGLPSLAALSPTLDITRQRNQTEEVTSARGPSSATNDYLKDVKPSMETMLNTREFVYYTYYQRIRAQLRQYWEPSIRAKVKKIFAQGRSIASTSDHITRVYIILDQQGSLLKVQVIERSGVYDLDDAAVEAFRAAEPFPNPPKGMMEADGTIKIRWDFILEA